MISNDDEERIGETALMKVAMVQAMVTLGMEMCGHDGKRLLELTASSPGVVLSLYMAVLDVLKDPDLEGTFRDEAIAIVKRQLLRLLRMTMAVVESDDPRATLMAQMAAIEASAEMDVAKGVH